MTRCAVNLMTMHVLVCVVTVPGCGRQAADPEVKSRLETLEAIRTELDPGGPPPVERAAGFELLAPDTPFLVLAAKSGSDCYASLVTTIRAQQGNNCTPGNPNQFVAEIAGWSEKCVDGCQPAARLAEINTAAAARCAAFCAQKGCGAQYAPRAQCGNQNCDPGSSLCNPHWPDFDA